MRRAGTACDSAIRRKYKLKKDLNYTVRAVERMRILLRRALLGRMLLHCISHLILRSQDTFYAPLEVKPYE